MEYLEQTIYFVLHLDSYLGMLIQILGFWSYAILFLIIFCETALVVTSFLPGDSLLFTIGTLAALEHFDLALILIVLSSAAILGDTVNYWVGRMIGPALFQRQYSYLNRRNLERTHAFYEKHGGKAIIVARFTPVIRALAPLVAGIGAMQYRRFLAYNVIGGLAWIALLTLGGYFFGNIPIVKRNFIFVVFAIIFISMLPAVIEIRRAKNNQDHHKQAYRLASRKTSEMLMWYFIARAEAGKRNKKAFNL
jgi:membrane-associated protein